MTEWLVIEILPTEQRFESLMEQVYQKWKELQIEPPIPGRIDRLIHTGLTQRHYI